MFWTVKEKEGGRKEGRKGEKKKKKFEYENESHLDSKVFDQNKDHKIS